MLLRRWQDWDHVVKQFWCFNGWEQAIKRIICKIFCLFLQIKVHVPSMHQWQYLLRTRAFPWVQRCLLRRQHVTQIPLSRPLMGMRVYRLFHTVPWYPRNITWLLIAQRQKHTGLSVTGFTQQCHPFHHARQMAWSANQITAYQWARLSVIKQMVSKEMPTLLRIRLPHIQYNNFFVW